MKFHATILLVIGLFVSSTNANLCPDNEAFCCDPQKTGEAFEMKKENLVGCTIDYRTKCDNYVEKHLDNCKCPSGFGMNCETNTCAETNEKSSPSISNCKEKKYEEEINASKALSAVWIVLIAICGCFACCLCFITIQLVNRNEQRISMSATVPLQQEEIRPQELQMEMEA